MTLVHCYNKGCGQKYDPEKNEDGSCHFHPGAPVFHDALKGWSCCKKRSTDFTEFLNTPGCTSGKHSNEKPPEPEKPPVDPKIVEQEVIVVKAPLPKTQKEIDERPDENEQMQRLKVVVGATLKQALEKQQKELDQNKDQELKSEMDKITIGTSCKNNSCKACYNGEDSDLEKCIYHSGFPVFHEGMKFWSCCQRKTSDFDNFLEQEGCEVGKHLWVKKESSQKKSCRFDWHQTPGFVTISVFSKVADPEKSYVEVNKVRCKIHVVFEGGQSLFEKDVILKDAIVPEGSQVKMLGTKVEIILKKLESFSWSALEFTKPKEQNNTENQETS